MLGTLRISRRRTLVLAGIFFFAIGLCSADQRMSVQFVSVDGSATEIVVSNPSPKFADGTIVVEVVIEGEPSLLSAPVTVPPGQSAHVSIGAPGPISEVQSVGIMDDPNPI